LQWDGKTPIKCVPGVSGDANGDVTVKGQIQVGSSNTTCTPANAGSIRFDGASKTFQGCNGSAWAGFGPPTYSAGGVDMVFQDQTGVFGYCRLTWGAVTACGATGVTCARGTPQATTMSHDDISAAEDQSPGQFIYSSGLGAQVNHIDCIVSPGQ